MNQEYIAHIADNGEVQSVTEHSLCTAKRAEDFSVDELKRINYYCALLHDIGKYSKEFQRYIRGENLRVEHSICGAKEIGMLEKEYPPLMLLLQLCIAGHHTGIPDCGSINDTEEFPTLYGRLKRSTVDYSEYIKELSIEKIDYRKFDNLLRKDCKRNADIIEKYAFFVRYCFSCLTDADSLDTKEFCEGKNVNSVRFDFERCIQSLDEILMSFKAENDLQKARRVLQNQAFGRISKDANVYMLNMPTGSGKTLASMRCALSRIEKSKGKLKRVIYVIPYNSIIDQTADTFEKIFSEHTDIVRHQSSFVYDEQIDLTEDYKIAAKSACENWDAGIIITTAVQFFESLYGDKRGKLKSHSTRGM